MRKIGDVPRARQTCNHPEHDPPKHIVLEPGIYEHVCPKCGQRKEVTIWDQKWVDQCNQFFGQVSNGFSKVVVGLLTPKKNK